MYLSLVTHYMIGDYKIINLQFYLMTHDWCSPILIIDFMIILISLRMSTCKVKSVGSEYMWKSIAKPEFTWAGRHNFKTNFIQSVDFHFHCHLVFLFLKIYFFFLLSFSSIRASNSFSIKSLLTNILNRNKIVSNLKDKYSFWDFAINF